MVRTDTPTGAPIPTRGPAAYGAPRDGGARRHAGVDLWVAPERGPVRSPVDGTVLTATYTERPPWGGYAPVVVVQAEGRPEWHLLAHVREIVAEPGQRVRRGDVVARGSSVTPGPHTHWEVRRGRWWPRYRQGETPWSLSVDPAQWTREHGGDPTEPRCDGAGDGSEG